MITELYEISCKTPHFCISLQLRLLKSESIWNIPSSTSSHHGLRRRQKFLWRRLHTPRSSSKVDQGSPLRVISSARSLLNDWSYHETLSHIWFITLRTWLPTDANYKARSNRSNFLSITYKTSQKRLQANIFYHKRPNMVQWRACERQTWVLDVFWANCSNLNWWLIWNPSLTNPLKIC